jgi:hypothetical protein
MAVLDLVRARAIRRDQTRQSLRDRLPQNLDITCRMDFEQESMCPPERSVGKTNGGGTQDGRIDGFFALECEEIRLILMSSNCLDSRTALRNVTLLRTFVDESDVRVRWH